MFIIKKIIVDDKTYLSSSIVAHTHNKKISVALTLFDTTAKNFIREEFGREAAEKSIIDVYNFDQITEPIVDGALLYRINTDPHSIHVYQRKTNIVKQNGWTGVYDSPLIEFKRTHIFELEHCDSIISNGSVTNITMPHNELVLVGPIKIPKPMTIAPMCNLITELKNSDKFKTLRNTYN